MTDRLRALALTLALPTLGGCYGLPSDVESTPHAITNGIPATASQRERAAYVYTSGVGGCTATIIGPRHLLTAAHCQCAPYTTGPQGERGTRVYFYVDGTSAESGEEADSIAVDSVVIPEGVYPTPDPEDGDFHDTRGLWADIAVLHLAEDVPAGARIATLSWNYSGQHTQGYRVGAGNHDGSVNYFEALRTNNDEMYIDSTPGGSFYTYHNGTNDGDSGGPFYRQSDDQLLGVLTGSKVVWGQRRSRYTRVSSHLDFILSAMNYTMGIPGTWWAIRPSGGVPATMLAPVTTLSERGCRYACDHYANCRAFSFVPFNATTAPQNCFLRSSAGGAESARPGAVTGVRYTLGVGMP